MNDQVVALYAHRLGKWHGTGISVYVRELIPALAAGAAFRYHMCGSREGPNDPPPDVDLQVFRPPIPRRWLHAAWTLTGRPHADRWLGNPDLLHVLYPSCPVPTDAPVVYTFHDLLPLTRPGWFSSPERRMFEAAARHAAGRATALIADSPWTAGQLNDRLGVPEERIHVVPLGVSGAFAGDHEAGTVAAVCERHGVRPGSYAVSVGAVSERKNTLTVIEAIRNTALDLLVIGPVDDKALVAVSAANGKVRLTGWLPRDELAALLAGAAALLHPSLEEGFGMTPLEAMAAGIPAVVSRAGALPETVQDAAVLVDPHDVTGWTDAINRLTEDEEMRCRLARLGRARAAAFTWQRTAEGTAAVYNSVLNRVAP